MSSYLIAKETIPKIKLCESPAMLAEFFHRDQYFKQFGGLALDPFLMIEAANTETKNEESTAHSKSKVMKTVSLNFIEELFVAPLEYHTI